MWEITPSPSSLSPVPLAAAQNRKDKRSMTSALIRQEISLPLTLESLLAAESQVDIVLSNLGLQRREDLAFGLRLVVNEGFRNAIVVEPVEGRLKVVRLEFLAYPAGIEIRITDPGRGFPVEEVYPPYPQAMTGKEYTVHTSLGTDLIADVVSSNRVNFRVEEASADSEMERPKDWLRQAHSRGMGILALCHECKNVSMIYHPESGNQLAAFYKTDMTQALRQQ